MSTSNCPHTHKACTYSHVIKRDGTLWHGDEMYVQEMFKQGIAKQRVDNPTRTYYFEYDETHPSYKERQQIQMGDGNVLQVEII